MNASSEIRGLLTGDLSASGDVTASVCTELEKLNTHWLKLEEASDVHVFQRYAWCKFWSDASAEAEQPEKPFVIVVRKGSDVVLIWPFVLRKMGPFRLLQSFGSPATQTSDALVMPGDDREHLLDVAWGKLRHLRGIDAVLLKGVRSDAVVAPILTQRAATHVTRYASAPFSQFDAAESASVKRRSSRTRNALARHRKALAEHGPVTFQVLTDAEDRVAAVRELLLMKCKWLERTGRISAGYAHPTNTLFLRKLARAADFRMFRLSVGERTAALEGGVLTNGYYWSLVQSYDECFAANGPGRLLFWNILQKASDLGIQTFDFLAPSMRHKSEWADDEVEAKDFLIPLNIRGRALKVIYRDVKPLTKTTIEKIKRWSSR